MVFKAAERFFLTFEVDIDSMTVILIKDGREGRTYDASQYFQYFVQYGGRQSDVLQLQRYFSMEFLQNMLVTGKGSETFECCMLFTGEDYKFLKCEMKLLESRDSNIVKIILEDISHKRVEQLEEIREREKNRPPKHFADTLGIRFDQEKALHRKRQGRYRVIIMAMCLLCIIASMLFFQDLYKQRSYQSAHETLEGCQRANQLISQRLDQVSCQLASLKKLAFAGGGQVNQDQLRQYIEDGSDTFGYESLFFTDQAGHILSLYERGEQGGQPEEIPAFHYTGKEGAFTADYFSDQGLISYKLGIEGLTVEGVSYKYLVAILDMNRLCGSALAASELTGRELAIVDGSGNILWARKGQLLKLADQQNLFEYLNQPFIERSFVYNEDFLLRQLAEKRSGAFDFAEEGQRMFGAYTPLPVETLYLVSLAKGEMLGTAGLRLLLLSLLTWAAFLLLVLSILYYQSRRLKEERDLLESMAYNDDVTGGMNIHYFNTKAKDLVKQAQYQYALVNTNLHNFGQYSEKYGYMRGNELIRSMFLGIAQHMGKDELVCRHYAEHMMILMKYEGKEQLEERLVQMGSSMVGTNFKMEFGVSVIRDVTMNMNLIKERTVLALKGNPGKSRENVVIFYYDGELLEKMLFEKKLETTMYKAFRNGEFNICISPRYQINRRAVCNGDAYAVWVHPEKGPLMPEQYLSVFERRGMIMRLDAYIFEEICRSLREHLDKSRNCMPVSMVLHRNLFNINDFMDKIQRIKERYEIPGELISFEISEEILWERACLMEPIIDRIREMGAGCIIGEYNGKYVPLEELRSLQVDAIKIGARLLSRDLPPEVIRSIIRMVQSLQAKIIVNDVNRQSDIEFLLDCGCDEAKGDAFAKDISLRDYINIL